MVLYYIYLMLHREKQATTTWCYEKELGQDSLVSFALLIGSSFYDPWNDMFLGQEKRNRKKRSRDMKGVLWVECLLESS